MLRARAKRDGTKAEKDDVGKIIGKQGRTARSIRTLLAAISVKVKHRYYLEILEQFDQEPGLSSAGVLPWHQSQPSGKLPSIFEGLSVADGSNDSGSCHRSYALEGSDALTILVGLERELDLPVGGFDLFFQLGKSFIGRTEQSPAKAREIIGRVFQHNGQAPAQLSNVLRQDDPILRQQAANVIHQLCPACYQAAAHPMQTLQVHPIRSLCREDPPFRQKFVERENHMSG